MEILNSNYRPLCSVTLPFENRQKYMHTFDLANIKMANGFEDYLDIIKTLCHKVGAKIGLAHMTVDEKIVQAGMSQRRPGPHVDGCFVPDKGRWGHGWLHYCNNINTAPIGRMPVIVASSHPGCRVWKGKFTGSPKNDGDLSHIASQLINGEVLPANFGYILSRDCVHESMVFPENTKRTFLRIALPVEFEPVF